MMNPSYPPGGDGGGSGGGPARPSGRRTYIGTREIVASGTWTKADDVESILAGRDPTFVEVDLECVGGGGAGSNDTYAYVAGGGGAVPQRLGGLALSDLPESAAVFVGVGGANSGWDGGVTQFGDLLLGRGGIGGRTSAEWIYVYYFEVSTYLNGPGHGASQALGPGEGQAYPSFASRPSLSRPGGLRAAQAASNGLHARTPFEYGSGGGWDAHDHGDGLGVRGGKGGWPGGGGGCTPSSSYRGGPGGNGVVRLHYYTRES